MSSEAGLKKALQDKPHKSVLSQSKPDSRHFKRSGLEAVSSRRLYVEDKKKLHLRRMDMILTTLGSALSRPHFDTVGKEAGCGHRLETTGALSGPFPSTFPRFTMSTQSGRYRSSQQAKCSRSLPGVSLKMETMQGRI